ncbi:fused MFS/spermidine synthase [Streptomyces sp. ACA25]|uniref:spermidine synthase n=1 Tax=Streptomyces sp. ACA25 TaxID=3022596 RepID=UPI0023079E5A|nr:fused MFS/spermidine synthase [Streptomyces sp. ACA25]MDB1089404.1 fused MFS/spermidine synthase [Streptomyces sp. ACA25]
MDEPIPVTAAVDHGTARLMPDLDRERAWLLTVDGAPQSYVDLEDPCHLEFEYVRRIGHVLDTTAVPGRPLEALHLGGGALTVPRYLAATRPGSRQVAVEADRRLAALVARELPLPPGSRIAVTVTDARAALEAAEPAGADVTVADVFQGSRTPAHLTTLSCVHAAARALRPEGIHLANVADSAPFAFLRSQLATLAAVFDELCLVAEPGMLRGRRFGNAVLVASRAPLPMTDITRRCAADAFPARTVHGTALHRFIAGARPVTDRTAQPSPPPPAGAFSLG